MCCWNCCRRCGAICGPALASPTCSLSSLPLLILLRLLLVRLRRIHACSTMLLRIVLSMPALPFFAEERRCRSATSRVSFIAISTAYPVQADRDSGMLAQNLETAYLKLRLSRCRKGPAKSRKNTNRGSLRRSSNGKVDLATSGLCHFAPDCWPLGLWIQLLRVWGRRW